MSRAFSDFSFFPGNGAWPDPRKSRLTWGVEKDTGDLAEAPGHCRSHGDPWVRALLSVNYSTISKFLRLLL